MNKNVLENTFESFLLFPGNEERKGEGGLRTQSRFKTSDADKPLVSIVTVVYNGEKHLEETIQSVLKQTYDPLEYIVIDGGSTDGTLNIIRKYEDSIDYWISEKDKGISDAFNKGIRCAQGEIIGMINADDWYDPDCIASVMEHFSKADILYGNQQFWNNGEKTHLFIPNEPAMLEKEMVLNHPAVFVKRNAYQQFGLYREDFRYAMDYELLLRFWKHGVPFFHIDSVLSNMRYEGVSDRYWYRALIDTLRAKLVNGENAISALFYFFYQFIRGSTARLFLKIGLKWLVDTYRENYSIVKKKNG